MRIGFDYACPKRVQKLLVGRSQTLLIYYILICLFVVLPRYRVYYVFIFIFCSFSLVCVGVRPLISV